MAIPLSCCAGLRQFPTDTLIEYDAKFKVCGQYKIIDYENLKFKYIKDIPCESVFGFSSQDIPKVLDWGRQSIQYGHQHCQ